MDIDAEGSPNSNSANRANGLRKGPSSCAECMFSSKTNSVLTQPIGRRLKIKCDLSKLKKGPCSSCEKRGSFPKKYPLLYAYLTNQAAEQYVQKVLSRPVKVHDIYYLEQKVR